MFGSSDRTWKSVSEGTIIKQLENSIKYKDTSGLLDVGCGENKRIGFTGIDIVKGNRVDLVGDVRCCFSPDHKDRQREYPDLEKLASEFYDVVYLNHFIEHITWKDIPILFDWVYSLLAPKGMVYIATNNMEFIVKVYLEALAKQHKRNWTVKFPADEHPDLDESKPADLQKWVNFKFFSGGSPGDHHYSCFDAMLLAESLVHTGFADILIRNKSTLLCVARKPAEPLESVDAAVWEATK